MSKLTVVKMSDAKSDSVMIKSASGSIIASSVMIYADGENTVCFKNNDKKIEFVNVKLEKDEYLYISN